MPPALLPRRLWTQPELDYLREHYPREGSAPVGRAIGRTVAAVKAAARGLGVRRIHWTAEELETLARERPVTSAADLAEQLGRSPAAVTERARRLGVGRGAAHWTAEEMDELAIRYRRYSTRALARRFRRSKSAVLGKAHRMGLTKEHAFRPKESLTRPRWTPREVQLLAALYPHTRTTELVKTLGRTAKCIHGKASRLGISKRDRLSPEAIELLHELRDAPGIVEYFVGTFGVGRAAVEGVLGRERAQISGVEGSSGQPLSHQTLDSNG